MSARREYDLAILGGGSAAFAAALKGAESEARVLLVNEGILGGTCVNVGCVPSKTMIRAAEDAHAGRLSRFQGIAKAGGDIDLPELIRQKDDLVARLRQTRYADVLAADSRISSVEGHARLLGSNTVGVGSETFRAGRIVVATGTRPARPPIRGLDHPGVWDSTTALAAKELPRELIVLGGRYVALELGQMFARLGSRVTILQRSGRILPGEDPDVAAALMKHLAAEGIDIRTDHQVGAVLRDGERWVVEASSATGSERFSSDAVLSALGRVANTEGLGDIGLDPQGFVAVDDSLATSLPGVFAAGDVIGDPLYVYAAAYEGALAAENALRGSATPRDYTAIPWVIFTDPQVSGVGLNETQARAQALDVDVSVLPLSEVPRALAARDTRGFVKLLRGRGTDRLVGARIVAPEGGEQIMEASLMLRFGLPVSGVARHFHPYLTQGEAMKLAMLGFDRDVTALSCCAS